MFYFLLRPLTVKLSGLFSCTFFINLCKVKPCTANEKIEALKKVKDGSDESALKSASEELSREMSKIGEAMAKETNNQQQPTDNSGKTGDPNIKDATYEEKKDDEGKTI